TVHGRLKLPLRTGASRRKAGPRPSPTALYLVGQGPRLFPLRARDVPVGASLGTTSAGGVAWDGGAPCRRVKELSRRQGAPPSHATAQESESVVVAEGAQGGFVVGPAGTDADEGFEEDLGPEQPLHLLAGAGADLAQAGAALADDDALLALAFDPDDRADAVHGAVLAGFLGEGFDLDGGRVGELGAELAHELLAQQFAGEEAGALVGDFVLAVQRRLLGQQRQERVHQRLQALALERGDRMHRGEVAALGCFGQERQQRGL